MFLLKYSPDKLIPLKADHNKNPHIEYSNTLGVNIKDDLQNKVNELIQKDIEFSWEFVDFNTLQNKAIYLQPNLPTNKPLRMLELKDIGAVADGGTIVKRTSEVESISITSIEEKDGITFVYYSL